MDRLGDQEIAPILVLGVGNILLGDDGVGPRLARELDGLYADKQAVECIDGGTQGLALLGYFPGRQSLIILDAFSGGKNPGEVSILDRAELLEYRISHATTAHEGNAGELLATANLLGELPERVFLIGIEPERVQTDLALSESVFRAVPEAFTHACEVIERELARITAHAAA